ncbi:uncharacterized mitochondrial protein-like protein [Tanacetum coccineum]
MNLNFGVEATKDETSGILKSFITGIENLIDHKVKWLLEKLPQQNRVAERRNRTLIEAARTMLADSKLPTNFWAEAVNTACLCKLFSCVDALFLMCVLLGAAFEVVLDVLLDFLIDALTRTMNYKPIVAGTQFNGFVGIKSSDNAGQARKEIKPIKKYILLPLWTADPPFSQDQEDPRKESECKDQEKEDNVNSTKNLNTVSSTVNAAGTKEVNVVGGKISIKLPFDLNMPALEDYNIFVFSRDDEDDGCSGDITIGIITTIPSTTNMKKMSMNLKEHGFVSTIQQRTNYKDLQNCLFACSLSQEEPKKEVDVHMYRSMIGSLMYLTSSRPDIMFAVCACARYQVNPKVLHLHAVKRIFRYLKGQPKLGLWYPKDSPFDLVTYTDSDYAGASLDKMSTTGVYQFLGCRLISWQCKK